MHPHSLPARGRQAARLYGELYGELMPEQVAGEDPPVRESLARTGNFPYVGDDANPWPLSLIAPRDEPSDGMRVVERPGGLAVPSPRFRVHAASRLPAILAMPNDEYECERCGKRAKLGDPSVNSHNWETHYQSKACREVYAARNRRGQLSIQRFFTISKFWVHLMSSN